MGAVQIFFIIIIIIITVRRYLCVSMPPAVMPLIERWTWVFNVRSDLCACCAHEGETGDDESALVLKEPKNDSSPCLDPD